MKNLLIKSIATTLAVGTIATALTFNGGATLDNAKTKIEGLTQTITNFGRNENAMKEKITTLKSELATLQEQLKSGEGNETILNDKITSLEGQIVELNASLTTSQEETTKANAQIEVANTKALALEEALKVHNEATQTIAPMSQEELVALVGEVTTPPIEKGVYNMRIGDKVEDLEKSFTVEIPQEGKAIFNVTSEEGVESPYGAFINGESKGQIYYNGYKEIFYEGNKTIILKDSKGIVIATINIIE